MLAFGPKTDIGARPGGRGTLRQRKRLCALRRMASSSGALGASRGDLSGRFALTSIPLKSLGQQTSLGQFRRCFEKQRKSHTYQPEE